MPRTPSGSLPGPRQQSSSSDPERKPVRSTSVPLSGGSAALRKRLQVSREDQTRVHSILATAEVNSQEIQVQKMENRVLRNKIEALMSEGGSGAAASGSAGTLARSKTRSR